ncbi:MAG: hypothetical protein K9G67_12500 [Bacteroidales bacterium]|nr:hypothetical protein [Bacteroidales bacterium]MCF8344974.1 hypothetical protein [Bacteroidales bacterium]MCF8350763.1 hypothetical protein [Bacteroidales bacterium]MCF8377170.1 hypothetical protein [Bacteroidales bacterium]
MERRNFIRNSGLLIAATGSAGVMAKIPIIETEEEDALINFDIAAGAVPSGAVMFEQRKWDKEIRQSSPYFV